MRGTLCMGDIVRVDDVSLQSIRAGDVIVFAHLSSPEHKTIHRVQSISSKGLITQGDNCPDSDSRPVTEQEFIGRVSFVERQGTLKKISGGRAGLLRATALRTLKHVRSFLHPVSRPLYLFLGKSIIVLFKWHPQIRRMCISTPSERITKYVYNNKTVAYWKQSTGEWYCIKPYDLILEKPNNTQRSEVHD